MGHEIITCDSIGSWDKSPEIAFLAVTQSGKNLTISGDITGKQVVGYVTVFGEIIPGQVSTRSAIRIPVVLNGATVTPTKTPTMPPQTTIPKTTVKTPKPTVSPTASVSMTPTPKVTYSPMDTTTLLISLGIGAGLFVYFLRREFQ